MIYFLITIVSLIISIISFNSISGENIALFIFSFSILPTSIGLLIFVERLRMYIYKNSSLNYQRTI